MYSVRYMLNLSFMLARKPRFDICNSKYRFVLQSYYGTSTTTKPN